MKLVTAISIFILLIIFGCEEKTEFAIAPDANPKLAVEGIVSDLNINHKIKLTLTHPYQNESPAPATGAGVRISNGRDIIFLNEKPAGSGEYYTPVMRFLSDQIYVLQIRYNGEIYLAEDAAVPVEPLQPLQYGVSEQPGYYNIVFTDSGEEPNYIHYQLDWSRTISCSDPADCSGEIFQYDLKSIDVHEIYKPGKESLYFPPGTRIVRVKYSVSEAYKDFLRSLLSETEWRGSVFDTERANPPGNVNNGAVGFFAVTTAVTDTLIVK